MQSDTRTLSPRFASRKSAKVPGATALTEAVARYYFKLLAVKDEYEVARLYTDGDFEKRVAAQFEGDYKLQFHLAPPVFNKPDPVTGEAKKSVYGPWMMGAFRVLAKMRGLRGTAFDVFGRTAERRMERALPGQYETLVDELVAALAPHNHGARGAARADSGTHSRLRPRQGSASQSRKGEGSGAARRVPGRATADAARARQGRGLVTAASRHRAHACSRRPDSRIFAVPRTTAAGCRRSSIPTGSPM